MFEGMKKKAAVAIATAAAGLGGCNSVGNMVGEGINLTRKGYTSFADGVREGLNKDKKKAEALPEKVEEKVEKAANKEVQQQVKGFPLSNFSFKMPFDKK